MSSILFRQSNVVELLGTGQIRRLSAREESSESVQICRLSDFTELCRSVRTCYLSNIVESFLVSVGMSSIESPCFV